jgi:hypothetical protein
VVAKVYLLVLLLSFLFCLIGVDIVAAKIQEENATIDPKTAGHFRAMYLDRFGRRDELKILSKILATKSTFGIPKGMTFNIFLNIISLY